VRGGKNTMALLLINDSLQQRAMLHFNRATRSSIRA
jgi:hypothetical protein